MDTQHAYDETTGVVSQSPPCRRRYFLHGLLPQLIIFEACIRRGSVTQAACELRIAQPTASCLVRKLSITFGGPLMLRRHGRFEATPLGERVLSLSAELIEALARFDARERAARQPLGERAALAPENGARAGDSLVRSPRPIPRHIQGVAHY